MAKQVDAGESPKKDFFVSFNADDHSWAQWIAAELRSMGYRVKIRDDWPAGTNWVLAMDRALQECVRVVAVLSPHYLGGNFTHPEWAAKFAEDPGGSDGKILPVRVGECKPTGLLGQLNYVNLVGLDEYSARWTLQNQVRGPNAEATYPGRHPHVPFPGGRAQMLRVPHPWNPYFEGRDSHLAELALGRTRAGIQAVYGMTGVGKTQLVTEYVWRHRSEYPLICWVKGSGSAGSLVSEYAALAEGLHVRNPGSLDQARVLAEVYEKISQLPGFLLVLDGVPGPGERLGEDRAFQTVLDFVPHTRVGHIIVTTQDQSWQDVADLVMVGPLAPDEAVAFLLKRTEQRDEIGARSLSEDLGFLPVALEQAGAYITQVGISFSDYRERLAGSPELFRRGRASKALGVSLDKMRADLPSAVELLEVCASLASDDIPRLLFCQPVPGLTRGLQDLAENIISLDDAIGGLRRHSLLLEVYPQSVDVHRLVQQVVLDRIKLADKRQRVETAVALVEALFPLDIDNIKTWALCDRLVPHAQASTSLLSKLGAKSPAAPRLLDRVAQYLHERASFAKAESQFDHALRCAEDVFGGDHPETARIMNNLGRAAYDRGDRETAKRRIERALAIFDAHGGEDVPELAGAYASALNNHGLVLRDFGQLLEAKEQLERSCRIRESVYDSKHPEVARALSNLGLLLQELGSPVEARAVQERALDIFLATHGREHRKPQIASRRLAVVLYDLGDLKGARSRLEKVLDFFEKNAYGRDHPEVARSLHHLAQALWDLGEYERARQAYERARDIFVAAYGDQHPALARTLTGLGIVLQDQARLPEAREALLGALRIFRAAFGSDHPEVARAHGALGFVSRHQLDLPGARRHLEDAIAILRAAYGEDVAEMGIPYTNLGLILQEAGDYDAAKANHQRALGIFFACGYGTSHHHVQLARSRLAGVLQHEGRFEEAKDLLEEALRVVRAKYHVSRPNHPDIARIEERLGLVCNDLGAYDEADAHLGTAVETFTATWGPDHTRTKLSVTRFEQAVGGRTR